MSEPSKNSEAPVSAPAVELARQTIVARDAGTGEALREMLATTPEEVQDAVRRARTAQRDWGARPIQDRVRALRAVLAKLVARRDELARVVSRETGKPRLEALATEVLPAADALDFALRNAVRILRDQPLSHRLLKLTRSSVRREPWGTVGLITSSSMPFFAAATLAVDALVAGNAVVHKPSEHASLTGLELEALVREAGLPPALYHCLPGEAQTGAAVVTSGVQAVFFTGGETAGRKVAAACGDALVPCQLELAGKDAAVVLEDAPLDRAAAALAWGAFAGSGAQGASVERIFVQESVAAALVERLVQEVAKLRTGVDRSFDVDVGAIATRERWERIHRHVEDAKAKGAIVLAGGRGRASATGGGFYEPTILTQVREDALVLREPTRGPVVAIVPISGEEEAVRRVNETPYGVSASVWTRDERAGERIARRLEVGSIFVNDVLAPGSAGEVPWGGVKRSGFGRTRGLEGLLAFTRTKHVAHDRGFLAQSPLWFPYSRERYEALSALIPTLFGLGTTLERLGSVASAVRTFVKRPATKKES